MSRLPSEYFKCAALRFYENGDYINAFSRMYYAVFHSMREELRHAGFSQLKSHKNVRNAWTADPEERERIKRMYMLREHVDYMNSGKLFEKTENSMAIFEDMVSFLSQRKICRQAEL